mmetsp:Transcript_3673/g.9542  ORF Transcript_3673/g.9542 Transcript_3673/m.9542 type:complete len:273 (+) Transcript_3673:957-1775(+)
MAGSAPSRTITVAVPLRLAACRYACAISAAPLTSTSFAPAPSQTKTSPSVSSRYASSVSRSPCDQSKSSSTRSAPVRFEISKRRGGALAPIGTLTRGYSACPPSASQNPSASWPSAHSSAGARPAPRCCPISLATARSSAEAPSPCHTSTASGRSSTNESPELSEAASASTWTAYVDSFEYPFTWKSSVPPPAPAGLGDGAASSPRAEVKPERWPPLRTTSRRWKMRRKCSVSLPCSSRTCVALPPSDASSSDARIADAPRSSCDDCAPCQK